MICRTLHIIGSHTVTVQDVAVNNDFEIPNNDGVDIDSSKLVWISGMNITAWDDGMCIKATYRVPLFPFKFVLLSFVQCLHHCLPFCDQMQAFCCKSCELLRCEC